MKAVLDVNLLVSALLSRSSAPAELLGHWLEGALELLVSPLLIDELERALAYPKLRGRIPAALASDFVGWLSRTATVAMDVPHALGPLPDPDDVYLLALARQERAALVSGDKHLLSLRDQAPIFTPRAFVEMLRERG